MKKPVIILAAMTLCTGAFAQRAKINTAKEYMQDGDMKKAVATINEVVNGEGKTEGDAWFVRGEIYEKLAEMNPADVASNEESGKSYIKVLEVKPSYEKAKIDPKLLRYAFKASNTASKAYNNRSYDSAIAQYQQVATVYEIEGGKHFAGNKQFDTVAARALKFQAMSAVYAKKNDQAIVLLNKAKTNVIARDPYVFSALIDLYAGTNNATAAESTINEAKALYPKDPEISRQEMNYYLRANKTEELVKRMEEAAKTDPDNSALQFNLGMLYSGLANPMDAEGKPKEKPTNSKELEAKSEMAYKLAIDADPTKAEYVFNLGALYFNNASDITRKMNDIKGTTEADNKKYDALKALRVKEFTKSLEFFQKSYNLLSAKEKKSEDEKSTYRSTLLALQQIYDGLGQNEKSDEMEAKIKELK